MLAIDVSSHFFMKIQRAYLTISFTCEIRLDDYGFLTGFFSKKPNFRFQKKFCLKIYCSRSSLYGLGMSACLNVYSRVVYQGKVSSFTLSKSFPFMTMSGSRRAAHRLLTTPLKKNWSKRIITLRRLTLLLHTIFFISSSTSGNILSDHRPLHFAPYLRIERLNDLFECFLVAWATT